MKRPINGQNGSQNQPSMLELIRNNDFYHIQSKKELHITNMLLSLVGRFRGNSTFMNPPLYVNVACE